MSDGYLHTYGGEIPAIPYRNGRCLDLSSHVAPMPLNCSLYLTDEDREEHKLQHPLEICRTRPPRKGQTDHHQYRVKIKIVDEVRVVDRHNSQVVLVKLLESSQTAPKGFVQGMLCIAKFHDPLYNDHGDGALDHFTLADEEYAKEVAVYQRLDQLQGDAIPNFYGSFSTEICTRFEPDMMGEIDNKATRLPPSVVKREVRCILIEHINGTNLYNIPRDISISRSQSIMKAILDTEARIYQRDIDYRDLHSNNVILVEKHGKLKAKFIDFCDADLDRCPDERVREGRNFFDGQYISPLLRWDIRNTSTEYPGGEELCHWVNFDWQKWLEDTYKDDIVDLDQQTLAGMRHTFVSRGREVISNFQPY